MKKGELGIMPKSLATFLILNSQFLILNSSGGTAGNLWFGESGG